MSIDAHTPPGLRSGETTNTGGTRRPMLAAINPITIGKDKLGIGASTTVTIRFAEAIAIDSFTTADLIVEGRGVTLSNDLRSTDGGITWTVTLQAPTQTVLNNAEYALLHGHNSTGNHIRVKLTDVTNPAGNAGVGQAVSAVTYDIDVRRPDVGIRLSDDTLTAGETTTVTFSFNEPVTGFDADKVDLSRANGTLGPLTLLEDGRTWIATFTPTAGISENNEIRVKLFGVADLVGNTTDIPSASAISDRYTINTGTTDQTTRLSARVTLTDEPLTTGEKTTVVIAFNKPVNANTFTRDDVDLTQANGTISNPIRSADGRTWTATFTPTDNVIDETNTISVNLAGVTDAAGTAATGRATSDNFRVTTALPNATITLADSALTTHETTLVTFTFNQPVFDFMRDDVVFDGTTSELSELSASNGSTPQDRFKIWTATLTPKSNVNDQTNTISVNLAGVITPAGKSGTGTARSANYTVNTGLLTAANRPTLAATTPITIGDDKLSMGESTTVTIRFAEAIETDSFSIADLTVGGSATLSNLQSTDGGTTWTVTLKAPERSDILGGDFARYNSTGNHISVNLTGVTNPAGNAGVGQAVSTVTYDIDVSAPGAAITLADNALTAGETTTVTITFTEPVTGFDASDVVLTDANGTLGPLTPNAGRTVWTATFTPTDRVNDAANTISLNLSGVRDDAGNAGVGSASSASYSVNTQLSDTTAPQLITTGNYSPRALNNELLLNFSDQSDIPTDSNRLPTTGDFTVLVNGVPNLVTNVSVNTDLRSKEVVLTLATPLEPGQGGVTVAYNDSTPADTKGIQDTAGNRLTSFPTTAVRNMTVDHSPPVLITTGTRSPWVNGDQLVLSFQDASNLSTDKPAKETFTVRVNGNARVVSDVAVHAEAKTVTLTLATAVTRGQSVTVAYDDPTPAADDAYAIQDVHGHDAASFAATAVTNNTPATDTTGPTATITLADSALTVGESTAVSFRFSEPVTGFDAEDIVLTDANGTLGPLTAGAERTVWTATFTPTANTNAPTNTIRVNLSGVADDADNAGTGSASSANYSVDTVRPTATITLADSALTAGESTTVSFRFSEPVTGFDASDIVLTDANGTLGPLTAGAERTVWTATFTPTANVNDRANTISVNLSGVADDAGNAGTGSASSDNYSVDTVRPTATITLADSALTVGETTTVSFRFSKPVNGFDTDDIVYTNGTLTTPTANAERTVWTATYTPTEDISARANTIRVNLAGVTDDAGNAGTGSASSANYSVDNTRPTATSITLADRALTAGESTTVSFRFNEPVNGFDASDIVCTSGTLSTPTANAERTVWTATFTPNANANARTNTIRVNLAGVTDDAGNTGTGSASSANYSVHTTRPTATITLADSTLTVGESTTVRFIFNEPVTGLDASDIVCPNGTLSTPTANAERTVWTATFTPNANANARTNTIRVDLAGVTNDAGNTGTGSASSTNYCVDTTRPTATITLADSTLTAGESTTVTITFSEPVTGLDASDIVCTSGTLRAPTANAERTVWTATFTPMANVNTLANTIRVNLTGISDDAGNAGAGSAISTNYSVNTERPTATITLADRALTVGESTTVTITFSEPVNGLDTSDIVLTDANGTLTTPTANTDRTVWTATFTPTANVNTPTNTIRVNLSGVRNDAGNAGTGNASSENYSVDTRPAADTAGPTATIALADDALTAGESTTVTFRFNEPVNGFDTSDIVCTSGTLSLPTANTERTVWTATFTPTANVNARTNTIRVNLSGVHDDAGNAGTGSASSDNYSVDTRPADTTGPTATIALADNALTAGETTTVTFRFNEPVNGLDASNIVLTDANGTLSTPTANTERTVWTATFTPTANVNARTNTIRVNLAGVRDDANNAGTGSASSDNYSVDTRPADTTGPTATIALADNALTAGESTTVTITFNEPVNNFDASDIVLTDANGTLSTPTANTERTVWTATFTPTANVNARTNTIRVNLAGVRDDANNAGTGSASSDNYSVDTRPADTTGPMATIALADSALTAGESTTVTFRFNEPVKDFDASDIVLTDANGTLSTPTANTERTVWTATFTPTANVNTLANTIRVNLSGVCDDADNAGTGSAISANYSVNTTRPTATIALADSVLTAGESTTVTFRFSEPVKDFDASDIVLTDANGTLTTPTANTGRTVWTATFTPTASISARTNTIRVDLSGVRNDAGNAGTGSAISTTYSVNTTRPTASIALADSALTAGESTTVTITFSEPVNGFDASDIVLTDANGTLTTPTANTERTVWTATFTPTANVNARTNTIRVNLAGVRDDADNAGTGSASSDNYSVDTRPADTTGPTATIALADSALTTGESTTVTITFNEPVNGLDTSDIVLTDANGTLTTPTANTERTVWTATFTPTANVNARTNTIRVNLSGVRDDAGNAGTGSASSDNYSVDTTRPTASITLADSALTAGETTTVTFRFNEPVNGFDASDIVCPNGTLSWPTASAERTVWTATFTPTANVSAPTNTIRLNLAGVTNDAGIARTGSMVSANYSVDTRTDTTGPTATITLANTHLTVGETTTVTFVFNEPVTGFTSDDVVLSDANGTLTDPTTNDQARRTWTATFTPTAGVENSNNTIGVNLAGVRNTAGRAGTGHAHGPSYQIDTRAPVLASATVNAIQLVLRYTEGSSLDATHIPPITAFTVRADNVLTAVTAIAVNAQEKTVSLTLATTVTNGQAVSVAYTDPTTGNDADAIQDIAGNDAASFAAMPVDNRTPAPPSPAPSPSPSPASSPSPSAPEGPTYKDTKDTDGDSIPDSLENPPPFLSGPSGAAPGDGNGDGVQDSTQAAVGSTSFKVRSTGESATSTSVTLVAGSQNGKLDPHSGARITRLEQKDVPAQLPPGMEMPLGLLRFEARLAPGHSSEKFSLYLDPALGVNGYWVKDGTGTWTNLSSAPHGGKMVSEGGRLRLDFAITDGGPFDADGQANGAITAPGAAAQMPLSIVGQASNVAHGEFWL
ncbi:hypothetical protein D8B24_19990 [Verminephrobacter aporrectodeae subsp. tuberculatae]|uniref:Ig-like domain-containing protein n=1 Tax=Verminephrobacter aporrectodeae TaxID=1110389 RepID=UPI0022444858|nr:Ig-like domain-containing protein [Verminephrobacter aporrectodeae]MCW8209239.1 hypothetical protein [Verminephrobacter aporrectodeae subsp. tuberculatae]